MVGFGFGCTMDGITVSHGITVSPPESYGLHSTNVCIIIYPLVLQDNSSKLRRSSVKSVISRARGRFMCAIRMNMDRGMIQA